MARRRCTQEWSGPCGDTGDMHACARPPGHPDHHACYCGQRPATDGQESLFALPWRLTAPGLAAAARRGAGDE